MKRYYIFKTDYISGKTIHVCNGGHDDERECKIHWQSYMYGFMDGAFEMLGVGNFDMKQGEHPLSFRFIVAGKMDVEYFMLFDQKGEDLIMEICKQDAI